MIKVSVPLDALAKIEASAKDMAQIIVAANLDLWNDVVQGTPVDTGFARASWWATTGGGVQNSPAAPGGDGASSIPPPATPGAILESAGERLTIANGAAYLRRLEYDGHSAQAPSGWIRQSAARYPENVLRRASEKGYQP